MAGVLITAAVAGEREVEYEGQLWRFSPLTHKVLEQKNQLNASGVCQDAAYWSLEGQRLKDMPDTTLQ